MAGVAVYQDSFGEAKALAQKGLDGAVLALSRPGPERLVGPRPKDEHGHPLAPYDVWGHDHCWWLDRPHGGAPPAARRRDHDHRLGVDRSARRAAALL